MNFHSWLQKQIEFYVDVAKIRIKDNIDASDEEILCIIDKDLESSFSGMTNTESHKKKSYKNQIRIFFHNFFFNDEKMSLKTFFSKNKEEIAEILFPTLVDYIENIPVLAVETIQKDIKMDFKTKEECLDVLEKNKKFWSQKRTLCAKEYKAATKAKTKNFSDINTTRSELDNAEKMCAFYHYVIKNVQNDDTFFIKNFLPVPTPKKNTVTSTKDTLVNSNAIVCDNDCFVNEKMEKLAKTIYECLQKGPKDERYLQLCKIILSHGFSFNYEIVEDYVNHCVPTNYFVVEGVGNENAHLRSVFSGDRELEWNNICSSFSVDSGILSGAGRKFTPQECEDEKTQDVVKNLFLTEPGCFRIFFFCKPGKYIDSVSHPCMYVSINQYHVTPSGELIEPGLYILSHTIYLPGFYAAVQSHLHLATGEPLYCRKEYDLEKVQYCLEMGEPGKIRSLKPLRITYAGNASLFMIFVNDNRKNYSQCEGYCVTYTPLRTQQFVSGKTYIQNTYFLSERKHLVIDSLCGCMSNNSNPSNRPRGVGFHLMSYVLARCGGYYDGVEMKVRTPDFVLPNQIFDTSVAFYYFVHFGFRVVSQNIGEESGLLSLKEYYKDQDTVTKEELKKDGVYPVIRNIVGELHADSLLVDTLCGFTPCTLVYDFCQNYSEKDMRFTDAVLYRDYPAPQYLYSQVKQYYNLFDDENITKQCSPRERWDNRTFVSSVLPIVKKHYTFEEDVCSYSLDH